jgi:hypothetical protein
MIWGRLWPVFIRLNEEFSFFRMDIRNGHCKFHGGLSTGPKTLERRSRALVTLMEMDPEAGARGSHLHRLTGQRRNAPIASKPFTQLRRFPFRR